MTNPIIKHEIVPKSAHGQRLDIVLAQLFPDYSRSQLSYWLKEGAITVNDNAAKPKNKMLGNERITLTIQFTAPVETCQPEDIPLSIVYEDEALLVLNKPSGLVVHPGAGNREHTLVNALVYHEPILANLPRAGIVHRLDKDTTGLLVVAKTLISHTALIRQLQAREVQRNYLALVQGHLISGGEIDTFYGRHPKNRLKMAVCVQGKQAITHYKIRKHYKDFTLLKVELLTGRTHQIRVHMNYINHPIVGDPLYGGRIRFPAQASVELRELISTFPRQALHAYKLAFTHPLTNEFLTFKASIPDDFERLLIALDENFA